MILPRMILPLGVLTLSVALAAAQDVTFRAADKQIIYGTYYPAKPKAPLVLLFHQASSNANEYASVAPRLVRAGFACLAIDQRSGGPMFGRDNRTVLSYSDLTGKSASYSEALPDLEAALAWSKTKASKVFVLGSSYSGGLVFELAARHSNDVAGVLAFSPEITEKALAAAAKVRMPVFVTSAADEVDSTRVLFKTVASMRKTQFTPQRGPHGASALSVEERAVSEPYWQALLTFLNAYR